MARETRGRGRLSRIEQLPEDFDDLVSWAAQELKDRKRTSVDIGTEFNEKLAERGAELGLAIEPISASSFHRHAFRQARTMRRMERAREIARVQAERLQPGEADILTVTATEMIKSLAIELMDASSEGELTPRNAMELASAMKAAVAAQKISTERREKLEAKVEVAVDETIEAVCKEAGLSEEQAADIREKVLGVPS